MRAVKTTLSATGQVVAFASLVAGHRAPRVAHDEAEAETLKGPRSNDRGQRR